jgi:hypothetical protein
MKNSCLDGVLMVEALYGLGGFFKVFWLEFSWFFESGFVGFLG